MKDGDVIDRIIDDSQICDSQRCEDQEESAIVTVRCTDMIRPVSDAVKVPCSDCGEIVWLSLSSRNIKFDKIICEQCFFNNEKQKDEDYSACITEDCINDALKSLERRGVNTTKEELIKKTEEKIGKKLTIVDVKDKNMSKKVVL